MAQQRIDIYLNGIRADIFPDATLAISYSINQFQDPSVRTGSFSNEYTLPFTQTNAGIFKNSEQLNSGTTIPYVKIPCRIESNGLTQVMGYAEQKGITDEGYVVTIFGDNVDWFSEIEGKSLQDVDVSNLDHEWTFESVIASANNRWEKGYAYPAVDYGKFEDRIFQSGLSFDELYPWVFRKYLLLSMFADAGYTLKGDFLTLPEFEDSYISLAEYPFKHSQAWINARLGIATQNTATSPPRFNLTPSPFVYFTYGYFPTVVRADSAFSYENYTTNNGDNYTLCRYVLPVRVKIKAVIQIQVPDTSTPTNITVLIQKGPALSSDNLELVDPVTSKKTFLIRAGIPTYNIEFESDTFDILAGEISGVRVFSGLGATQPGVAFKPITYTGTITQTRDEYILPNETFNLQPNLPDISQGEFITELANEFCLMFSTDAMKKEVRIDHFEKIAENIPLAVDWSNKVDFTLRPAMDFNFAEYGQVNNMLYAEDESDVELVADPSYGDGIFSVANQHLDKTKDVYESIYAATKSRETFQVGVILPFVPLFLPTDGNRFSIWNAEDTYFTTPVQDYVIYLGRYFRAIANNVGDDKPPLYEEDGDIKTNSDEWVEGTFAQFTDKNIFESNTPKPRVLVADRTNTSPVLMLTPGTVDTYVEYVSNATFEPLRFDAALLPTYYKTFEGILFNLKFLKAQVRLNAVDIAKLDFLVPVLLDVVTKWGYIGGYFYINQIIQYLPGSNEAIEVELLRLPAKMQGAYIPLTDYSEIDYNDSEFA